MKEKQNSNNNNRMEWDGYCPKCDSDNIECTDENGSGYHISQFFWKCHDCQHTFRTTKIEVIDEVHEKMAEELTREAEKLKEYLEKQEGWKLENCWGVQEQEGMEFTRTDRHCPVAQGVDKERLEIILHHFE